MHRCEPGRQRRSPSPETIRCAKAALTVSRTRPYHSLVKPRLRSVHVLRLFLLVVSTVIVAATVTAICLIERDGKVGYRLARWWMAFNLWMSGVRVKVSGLERLDRSRQYV